MREKEIQELFDALSIRMETLDEHYDPEVYGKKLMNSIETYEGVAYAGSTTLFSPDFAVGNQ